MPHLNLSSTVNQDVSNNMDSGLDVVGRVQAETYIVYQLPLCMPQWPYNHRNFPRNGNSNIAATSLDPEQLCKLWYTSYEQRPHT
eukprot:scaffold178103_cov45-Prasinocladus_malaysianus.AAC.3